MSHMKSSPGPVRHLGVSFIAAASLFVCLLFTRSTAGQQAASSKVLRAIVSPSRPKDSRGETVYESRGDTEKNQPVVPGILIDPIPIKLPDPKYPKSMKKARAEADVTVLCVFTATGDVIDPVVEDTPDPDAASSATAAVLRYKLKPATLDGQPVASLMKAEVHFRIR